MFGSEVSRGETWPGLAAQLWWFVGCAEARAFGGELQQEPMVPSLLSSMTLCQDEACKKARFGTPLTQTAPCREFCSCCWLLL